MIQNNLAADIQNWSTKQFADYVRGQDTNQNIILARDHGGPWQNELEKSQNMNLKDAMQSAKDSYRADIDAGFHMLHIDPSVDIHSQPNIDQVLERVYELYDFCWSYAQQKNQDIMGWSIVKFWRILNTMGKTN